MLIIDWGRVFPTYVLRKNVLSTVMDLHVNFGLMSFCYSCVNRSIYGVSCAFNVIAIKYWSNSISRTGHFIEKNIYVSNTQLNCQWQEPNRKNPLKCVTNVQMPLIIKVFLLGIFLQRLIGAFAWYYLLKEARIIGNQTMVFTPG